MRVMHFFLVVVALCVLGYAWWVVRECENCGRTEYFELFFGTVVALGLTISIAWRQDQQAHQILKIGEDTHKIAVQITGEKDKQANVARFFSVREGEPIDVHAPIKKFDGSTRKPLPTLNTGDSFGYSILAELIGSERLVPRLHETRDLNVTDDICLTNITRGSRTHICLCSPRSNPVLHRLAPIVASGDIPISPPVWFQWKSHDSPGSRERYVQIANLHQTTFVSAADKVYLEAANQDRGSTFHPPDQLLDYGIVARLTKESLCTVPEGKTLIVIAGIHQYGTWIASEFVKRNIHPKDASSKLFSFSLQDAGTPDFACVVLGKFLTSQQPDTRPEFRVGDIKVVDLWKHENGEWISRLDVLHQLGSSTLTG